MVGHPTPDAEARWRLALSQQASGQFSELQLGGAEPPNTSLAFALRCLGTGGRVPEEPPSDDLYSRAGAVLRHLAQARWAEAAAGSQFPATTELDRAWLANLRSQAHREAAHHSEAAWQRHEHLTRAQTANRTALKFRFPLTRCAALREAALLACAQANLRQADRLFQQSAAMAEKAGYLYELRLTQYERERVFGDPTRAWEELVALGAYWHGPSRPPLALTDRFDLILEWGRKLATCPDPESVYTTLRQAAVLLLRAPEAWVVGYPEPNWLAGPPLPAVPPALQTAPSKASSTSWRTGCGRPLSRHARGPTARNEPRGHPGRLSSRGGRGPEDGRGAALGLEQEGIRPTGERARPIRADGPRGVRPRPTDRHTARVISGPTRSWALEVEFFSMEPW